MHLTRLCALGVALCVVQGVAAAQEDGRRKRWREGAKDRADAGPRGAAVHGGKLVREAGFVFELVLDAESLRIYVTTEKGEPVPAKKFAGKVNIAMVRRELGRRANHQSTAKKFGVLGKSAKQGRLRSCLATSHPLGKADQQRVRVDVTLTKVPGRAEPLEFRAEATGSSRPVAYVCPNGCGKGSFLDPGECPKCEKDLEREGAAGDRRGDAAEDGEKADGEKADGEPTDKAGAEERRKRWRERQEQRRRERDGAD